MNNTIQLYTDDERNIKGYPITTPDRVIDEKGKSIKRYLKNNVKFSIAGEGVVVPPINGDMGSNDNIINGNTSELIEEIETINRKVENIKNQLTRKADKDGSLQENLNAEKVGGKTVNQLALKSELNSIKDNIPTLDEDGRIPQSQIGIMNGVDLLYRKDIESQYRVPKVTITDIPNKYKYYELLVYGNGRPANYNKLLINDKIIENLYTSMNEDFFMRVIITNNVYFSGGSIESRSDGFIDMADFINFSKGIPIGDTLDKILIDVSTPNDPEITMSWITYVTLFGYR